MSRKDVMVIRESIERIVNLLTTRKIKVTQRGASAHIAYNRDGSINSMNIPFIAEDATDDFIAAVQGFLDHEVGHVLFSDYAAIDRASKLGKRVANMHNIIEDVFIERCMAGHFAGTASNLQSVRGFYLDKVVTPKVAAALKAGDAQTALSYLMVVQFRAWGGQTIAADYLKTHRHAKLLETFCESVGDDMPEQIALANSSDECLILAERIVKRISDYEEKKRKEAEKKAADEAAKKAEKAPKAEKSPRAEKPPKEAPPPEDDDKGEPEDEPEGGEDDESEDDKGDDGEGESEGDESEDDKGDEPEAADDADEPEGDDKGDEPAGDDGDGPEGEGDDSEDGDAGADTPPPEEDGPLSSMLDEVRDFDKAVADSLTDAAKKAAVKSDYSVFSNDWDVIEPAPLASNAGSVGVMESKTSAMVSVMVKQLERAMAAQSRVGWNPGMRSGRLNAASLFKSAVGDDRLFRHKYERHSKRTAVSLLIDCSGSMSSGDRIGMAADAAYGLSMALERLRIPYEVLGFTCKPHAPHEMEVAMAKEEAMLGDRVGYGRNQPLYIPVFKSFDGKLDSEAKSRIAGLTETPRWLNQNPDGECVQIAGHRLMQRKDVERRVLIVMSDGAPYAPPGHGLSDHLRKVVKELEGKGVEVVGIGIQTSAVKSFYPKNVVLNNLAELPGTTVRELAKVLLAP